LVGIEEKSSQRYESYGPLLTERLALPQVTVAIIAALLILLSMVSITTTKDNVVTPGIGVALSVAVIVIV